MHFKSPRGSTRELLAIPLPHTMHNKGTRGPNEDGGSTLTILQLTDIHIDPSYSKVCSAWIHMHPSSSPCPLLLLCLLLPPPHAPYITPTPSSPCPLHHSNSLLPVPLTSLLTHINLLALIVHTCQTLTAKTHTHNIKHATLATTYNLQHDIIYVAITSSTTNCNWLLVL